MCWKLSILLPSEKTFFEVVEFVLIGQFEQIVGLEF